MSKQAICKQLGWNLLEARERAGLTQKQLAGRVSSTQAYICVLERGRGYPALGTLLRLAAALDVSAADLLEGVS
jgi:transcriptional regulator with XRE-family HTH domain